MRIRWPTLCTLGLLFIVTAGLMIGAMRQESATADETGFLVAGCSYWHGHPHHLNPSHPPLAQLLASLPLTMLDATLSPVGSAFLSGRAMAETSERWDLRKDGPPLSTPELFPHGPGFYHFPVYEQYYLGGDFVYGGQNDAEKLLFWGRISEVSLTLLMGLLVFLWARHVQGGTAGLLAASMVLLNPVILAYGHIVQTDIGMALTFPLSVWMFARLLDAPSARRAVFAGLAAGLALAIKYTAVILLPTFVVLWLLYRWRHRDARSLGWKRGLLVAAIAWALILLVYTPHWALAPPIDAVTAAKLAVPHWFVVLRPVLIPAEYFKGLAMTLLHASTGNEAYLNGAWSTTGWWYYFPLALAMKTPLTFLLFAAVGIALAVRSRRELHFAELAAWVGAAVYLLSAMWSKANLGVRHILAVYPLVSVGAACAVSRWTTQVPKARRKIANLALVALPVASLVVVLLAYPFFICYMNPLVGGSKHGQEHLLDSNFDWGQDVKRLKQFLDERGIHRIYLQYFGTQAAIEYYGIANDFVDGDAAKQIRQGWLVVSAHLLMHPEWKWLRESRQPVARVGYTLFVYQIGDSGKTADPGK